MKNSPLVFSAIVYYSLWARFSSAESNSPCTTSGKCGAFGVCNKQGRPICNCLLGFHPRNNQEWVSGNSSGGCIRSVPLNGELGQDQFFGANHRGEKKTDKAGASRVAETSLQDVLISQINLEELPLFRFEILANATNNFSEANKVAIPAYSSPLIFIPFNEGLKLQDHVSTVTVVGTYGYMSPEYAIEGRFSEKLDVFSFGVVMLKITTGRRNKSFHQDGSLNLLGHVWNLWNEDNVASIIDRRISSSNCHPEVMSSVHIGLLCVQELPRYRPSISAVMSMLMSEITELPKPKKPAFAIKSSPMNSSSINDVSLSVVYGR